MLGSADRPRNSEQAPFGNPVVNVVIHGEREREREPGIAGNREEKYSTARTRSGRRGRDERRTEPADGAITQCKRT